MRGLPDDDGNPPGSPGRLGLLAPTGRLQVWERSLTQDERSRKYTPLRGNARLSTTGGGQIIHFPEANNGFPDPKRAKP